MSGGNLGDSGALSHGGAPLAMVKLQQADGAKVYNLTADKVQPEWVKKKKGTRLSRDVDYANHVELLQDFGFPSACHKVKVTRDGQHVFASGVHAPRVRVYEVANLALKFEHHFDSEIVNFQVCQPRPLSPHPCHHSRLHRLEC